jgi:hypothetical protein
MSAKPAENQKDYLGMFAKAGKTLAVIAAIALVIHWLFSGSGDMRARNPALSMDDLVAKQTHSIRKPLVAGEWSDWVDVSVYVLNIWPATAEVEYECKDSKGKVTSRPGNSKPGLHNWNDLTVWQRYKSKVDTEYNTSLPR